MSTGATGRPEWRSGARGLDPGSREALWTLLDEARPLIPFAEAVVIHLTYGDPSVEARARMIAQVTAVLDVDEESDDADRLSLLVEDPALLASIFQNLDLLDPSHPSTDSMARLVMAALERIGDVPA